MLNTKTTKTMLVAILTTGILSAFPEPADMHVDVERMVEDAETEAEARSETPTLNTNDKDTGDCVV